MLIIILFLLILLIIVCLKLFSYHRALYYINKEFKIQIENDKISKFYFHTTNKEVISLLNNINLLSDKFQLKDAHQKKTLIAMKKILSNIAHDIKTPLAIVSGYLELLNSNRNLSITERTDFLSKAEKKNKQLVSLVNKFFFITKLESGDTKLQFAKVNICELSRETLLSYFDILSKDNYTMDINIPSEDIYIYSSIDALERIINNLVSNAIHHGNSGKYLGFSLISSDNYVELKVIDKGPGIPEDKQGRIFERLYTSSNSRNSDSYGSGLGLSIITTLLEKLDGSISVESSPFQETTFKVKLKKLSLK